MTALFFVAKIARIMTAQIRVMILVCSHRVTFSGLKMVSSDGTNKDRFDAAGGARVMNKMIRLHTPLLLKKAIKVLKTTNK